MLEVKLIVLLVASGPSAVLEATWIQPAGVLAALGKVTGPVNVLLPPRISVPAPGLYKPKLLAPPMVELQVKVLLLALMGFNERTAPVASVNVPSLVVFNCPLLESVPIFASVYSPAPPTFSAKVLPEANVIVAPEFA